MGAIRHVSRFIEGALRRHRDKWQVTTTVNSADQIPDVIPAKSACLIGDPANPKWIAFDCPCGRDHRLLLNLSRNRRPTWQLEGRKPLSLRPSIDSVHDGRRCHFWLRAGHITWVKDT